MWRQQNPVPDDPTLEELDQEPPKIGTPAFTSQAWEREQAERVQNRESPYYWTYQEMGLFTWAME